MINSNVPKISVIIPVYNVEKYIQRCIDSILNQSFTDFEIIVINDASPDRSMEIARKYYSNNPQVRLLENKQNIGLGPTRNHGMAVAKGEYIVFIDSDDYVEVDYLAILYKVAIRENADVASCGYKTVNENGDIKKYGHIPIVLNGGLSALDELINRKLMVGVWLKIYRRSFLKKNKLFFWQFFGEDVLFHFMVVYFCKKFVAVPDSLYCYFQSSQSMTRGKYNTKWTDSFCEIFKYIEQFIKQEKSINLDFNSKFELRIYKYFLESLFTDTFSEAFQENNFAKELLEKKLLYYFPKSYRYILVLVYELIESKKTINQYQQQLRAVEISTPILAQANRRYELASFMLRLNQQDWDMFVNSNAYEAYWGFIYKILWQEQRLPYEDKAYHELLQYLNESREIWQLHCIYFASLLYEKPWNISFLPDLLQLPKELLEDYLKYIGHITAEQANCNDENYMKFNEKFTDSWIKLLT